PDRCHEHGLLAHLALGTIEREVDALLEDGLLARTEGDYPVIQLTEAGRARVTAAPPLVLLEPESAGDPARRGAPASGPRSATRGDSRSGDGRPAATPPSSARSRGRADDALTSTPASLDGTGEQDDEETERLFERLRAWT